MEKEQSENRVMEREQGQEAKIRVDESPHFLRDFLQVRARYDGAVILRDGLRELFVGAVAWKSEQPDFDKNLLKRALFLALCEKIDGQLSNINVELHALSTEIKLLEENVKAGEKTQLEVSHG